MICTTPPHLFPPQRGLSHVGAEDDSASAHATTETHAEEVQRKRGGGRHADLGT